MITHNEENQERLIDCLIATQSFEVDEPYAAYYERREAFEFFLSGPDGIPGASLETRHTTLQTVLNALDSCVVPTRKELRTFMKEKFGVRRVSADGMTQLLFCLLDEKGYIGINYTVDDDCYITDAGKVFRAILRMYLNEPDAKQILNWEFDLDFDAVIDAYGVPQDYPYLRDDTP